MLGRQIEAVLFDLDGTLVDTAPDLAAALNATLAHNGLKSLTYDEIRPIVSNGADALIVLGFGSELNAIKQKELKAHFISFYQQHIADKSVLFEGMSDLLNHFEKHHMPWGIVTNKPEYLTTPLLEKMSLNTRAACVVCGDQVKNTKPHPESIYLACQQINISPDKAVYMGDAERDIRAGRLAGLTTVACRYGYIPNGDNINDWQADISISSAAELLDFLHVTQ